MAEKIINLTVLIVRQGDRVLLGYKKTIRRGRRFGLVLNGFGGEVKPGESVEQAAVREAKEEARILVKPQDLIQAGIIQARFLDKPGKIFKVYVFFADKFSGEPQETKEMKPQWFDVDKIPFDRMWTSDRKWFHLFLERTSFRFRVVYDGPERNIVEFSLEETGKF